MLSPHVPVSPALAALCGALVASAPTTMAAEAAKRTFDLPRGDAALTLKQFAAAGLPIVYLVDRVRGATTNAVRGEFTPREALEKMLAGSGLQAGQDAATGAFVVSPERRAGPPARTGEVGPVSDPQPKPKSKPMKTPRTLLAALAGWLAASSPMEAQTAASPPASPVEETITLSPFEVRTDKDQGYVASATLAGSRLNTSLFDTPASISVFTREFLADIGATTIEQSLSYALNAEPDRTDATGNGPSGSDITFNIRGFSASLARNYFAWGQESESYNVERLDFARGPNAILFGTGAPGGIINTTTKRAVFGRAVNEAALRIGSWNEYRGTLDVGRHVGDKLAVRVNALASAKDDWREFLGTDRSGAAFAGTYRPFKHTDLRVDAEYGDVNRTNSNPFLPSDFVTTWIGAGRPVSQTYGAVVPGSAAYNNRALVFDVDAGTATSWFGSVTSVGAPASPSSNAARRALTDFSILPLEATVSGTANQYEAEYWNLGVFLEQRIGDLWLEGAANRQERSRLWLAGVDFANDTLFADMNAFLPDGRPNPNVGRTYVQGNAQIQTGDVVEDDFRFTAAYKLDLTRRHPWLGQWQFAGLASRREGDNASDAFFERNVTPAGTALYPADIANGNNALLRRVYVDPFGPGRRGAVDPRDHPVNVNGVKSGFARTQNQGGQNEETLESLMGAVQGRLLKDRLIVTSGRRRDYQNLVNGTATPDPVTRLWSRQDLSRPSRTSFKGTTETYGGVLRVTPDLVVFYNNSNNFQPQNTLTIDGTQLGPKTGEGEDCGIKVRLFDQRFNVTLTRYTTSEVNRLTFANGALIGGINEIYEATGNPTRVAGPTSRDGIDTEGDGYEFELTANPTRRWRLSFNLSQTRSTASNNQRRNRAYVESRIPEWRASGAASLIAPYTNGPSVGADGGAPRVSDAIVWLEGQIATILGANGVTRRQLREWNSAGFTAYTFAGDNRWLKDLTVGGGYQYRGEPVVGYTAGGTQPIFGDDELYVNTMLAKNVKLFGQRVRLQANFNNILAQDELIVVDADTADGYRFLYPRKFSWSLQASVQF